MFWTLGILKKYIKNTMKFIKPTYKLGQTRIIKKFALFPITIGNETRWLERVWIEQKIIKYIYIHHSLPYPPQALIDKGLFDYLKWENIKFLDKRQGKQ